jgi:hypothetical protein
MISEIENPIDAEVAVAAGRALDFDFVGDIGRR